MSLTATTTTTTTSTSMPNKMESSTTFDKQPIVSMGDKATYFTIALNVIVTMAVLLGLPSSETFDDSWRENGQCYTSHQVSSAFSMDTSELCCLLLCSASAIVLTLWYRNKSTMNEHLVKKLPKMAEANVSHGTGHYFVHLIGGSIPRVRPLSFTPADMGYTLVLMLFWPSILRSNMPKMSFGLAFSIGLIMIAFQAAIDIEPHLQFAFTQAVVLLFQSMALLTMSTADKLANPWTYLISALYYTPLFPMMWLEVTQCSEWVAGMGGHAIYDLYLALASIALAICIPYIEPGSTTASSLKKTE